MTDPQADIVNRLQSELRRIRAKNPSFSLRAYARKLGVAPSTLSEVLNKRHPVTRRMAIKFAPSLGIPKTLVASMNNRSSLRDSRAAGNYNQIDMDEYPMIADWHPFAIVSLAETRDFDDRPEAIAQRLGISTSMVRETLARLVRLGLLKRDAQGRHTHSGKQFATSSGIPNSVLRQSHIKSLELVRRSMETDPTEACDFSAMTMAIDPDKLPEAKRRLRVFRRGLCKYLESGKRTEVFKLNLHLFPLSRRDSK